VARRGTRIPTLHEELRRVRRELRAKDKTLYTKIGNQSKNFFQVDVWEAQGFIDDQVEPWKPVPNKPPGQKILVRTGRLRRSAGFTVGVKSRVTIFFNTQYASFVNKLRQFIGNSRRLDSKNMRTIEKHITRIFNGRSV
jgi:hypothetical protein